MFRQGPALGVARGWALGVAAWLDVGNDGKRWLTQKSAMVDAGVSVGDDGSGVGLQSECVGRSMRE